jgi:hypothetical protein
MLPSFDAVDPVASLGEFDRRLPRAGADFEDLISGCNPRSLEYPIDDFVRVSRPSVIVCFGRKIEGFFWVHIDCTVN